MNWESPALLQSLQNLRETLGLAGRDSRIVRWAVAYSRYKKRILSGFCQLIYGLCGKRAKEANRLRVFFWLAGGMGDAACARRLVEAYSALLPQAEIEIYAPLETAAKTVFSGLARVTVVPSSRVYWKNYDLVVFACLGVKFLYADEARLSSLALAFMPVFKRACAAQKLMGDLLEDPFLTEPVLGRWLFEQGGRRFDLLSFTGGVPLEHDAKTRLAGIVPSRKAFGLSGVRYVTFHDGTGHVSCQNGGATRSWGSAQWAQFLSLFKKQFPDIKLVQLGGKNSPVYTEADLCLAGKTDLTDLPDILEGALCHVDTESGLVHLAQFLNVKSVVLFGPSDVHFFGYAKNKNLSTGDCGGCMWLTPRWMTCCPLKHREPVCMRAIPPQQVLEAVSGIVSAR